MGTKLNKDIIFTANEQNFNKLCLEVFHYQAENNEVYAEFLRLIRSDISSVSHFSEIPCLPVEFFKNHRVITGKGEAEAEFRSSATTSSQVSRHFVADTELYRESFLRCFELFYGKPSDFRILALLPSYLEREHSSLVFMVKELIELSGNDDSGFYLYNHDELLKVLHDDKEVKTILFGVSFALTELGQKNSKPLPDTIIIETGGMKGRKKELIRADLHSVLKENFGVKRIHSEYGMTELLSQAYAVENGRFRTPPWMKVFMRDTTDPFSLAGVGQSGGINVIDLANLNSCSFIATSDLGRYNKDGSFEVLGRFDHSDVRGCSLMV